MSQNGLERDLLLALYKKSLLKQAKYNQIVALLPDTSDKTCLDIGADNGVLSYLLRQRGGLWHSADLDQQVVQSIRNLVGERVYRFDGGAVEFDDNYFDVVVIIDFLEHIETDRQFIRELCRVLKPGGLLIVNVPHFMPGSLIRRLRLRLGLTDQKHGHVRPGYTLATLLETLQGSFRVEKSTTYSRFFVELYDAVVSVVFERLSGAGESSKGTVVTGGDLARHRKKFRLFSVIYPFVWCLAQLDRLLPFTKGYSLIVSARPELPAGQQAQ